MYDFILAGGDCRTFLLKHLYSSTSMYSRPASCVPFVDQVPRDGSLLMLYIQRDGSLCVAAREQ